MGGLFGGGKKSNSQQAPAALSLRVQTSAYGMTRPILLGRNRLTGNLLWYGDFVATPHTESSGGGGGKGGGGGGVTTTTYTYSVYAQYGLCEGTIQEIRKIYREKGFEGFANSETGLGSQIQTPWTYVASAHPAESLNYSGTAWWAKGLDLGDNANMPNFSFDVIGGLAENTTIVDTTFTASGNTITVSAPQLPLRAGEAVTIYSATNALTGEYWLIPTSTANVWQLSNNPDSNAISFSNGSGHIKTINHNAAPKNIFVNLLTNSGYGAQFPAAMLDTTLTQFDAYTRAAGIFLSPLIDSSDTAQTIIQKLADICNSQPLWSNGKLTMLPYGDSTITGNGVTYTPNVTPIYDLNDDDFIVSSPSEDPVKVTIRNQNDTFNTVQVEFLNATNQFNAEPVEVQDLANIEAAKQIRADSTQSYHWITEPRTAMTVAQNRLQRGLYIRAQYEFQLGWKYCLLEPMDIVTITDEALGLQLYPVRILEINEDETGVLSVTAEEFPAGIGHAALYPHQDSVGNRPSHTVDAGNINAPIIFDAPVELTNGDYQVWMGVSGSLPSWGGCQVWMSNDGVNYAQVATFRSKSRMGVLSANMPANYAATDTTSTLSINTFESGGEILSVTDADLNALTSLIYVDGEFMAYRDATLTGVNAYDLKQFKRGLYNSNIGAHISGSNFIRCDDQLVKISLPIDQIGKTKYIKFLSFTIYGDDVQDLSQVSYYTYTPTGQTQSPVTLVTASARAKSFFLNWKNPSNFDFDHVEIWINSTNDRTTATKYGEVKGTMATVAANPGNYYIWLKAIGKSGKSSAWEPVSATGGVLAVSNPDSLIGNLTNESVVLSADSSGNVSSFTAADGQFVVYQGNIDVTLSCTFAKASNTGCTAAIDSTGNYSVSAMSADSATAVFTATYQGVVITKILSLAKAKAGTSGTNGADGPYWLTQYAVTTSTTTEPASGWQDTMPTVPISYYLWQRQGIVQPPATTPSVWGAGVRLTGVRGSKQFYLPNYTSWSTPPAATFPDGAPVLNDVVTEYGSSGFSETRFWDGSAWAVITQVINGSLLVNGSIGAAKLGVTDLSAISANLGTITSGSLSLVGTNNFSVKSGSAGARMEMTSQVIAAYDAAGVLRVKLGNLAV